MLVDRIKLEPSVPQLSHTSRQLGHWVWRDVGVDVGKGDQALAGPAEFGHPVVRTDAGG